MKKRRDIEVQRLPDGRVNINVKDVDMARLILSSVGVKWADMAKGRADTEDHKWCRPIWQAKADAAWNAHKEL